MSEKIDKLDLRRPTVAEAASEPLKRERYDPFEDFADIMYRFNHWLNRNGLSDKVIVHIEVASLRDVFNVEAVLRSSPYMSRYLDWRSPGIPTQVAGIEFDFTTKERSAGPVRFVRQPFDLEDEK